MILPKCTSYLWYYDIITNNLCRLKYFVNRSIVVPNQLNLFFTVFHQHRTSHGSNCTNVTCKNDSRPTCAYNFCATEKETKRTRIRRAFSNSVQVVRRQNHVNIEWREGEASLFSWRLVLDLWRNCVKRKELD